MENTRKLMALSGKVRPHDSKNPLPSITSPNLSSSGRRQPMSPRHSRPPVHLSAESSSVVSLSNIANRKPSRTGKLVYHMSLVTIQYLHFVSTSEHSSLSSINIIAFVELSLILSLCFSNVLIDFDFKDLNYQAAIC